jgi:hypothetical protein
MRKITTVSTIAGAFLALMTLGTLEARADEPGLPFGNPFDPCLIAPALCVEVEVGPIAGGSPGTVIAPELPDETTDALEAPIVDVLPLAPLPPELVVVAPADETGAETTDATTPTTAPESSGDDRSAHTSETRDPEAGPDVAPVDAEIDSERDPSQDLAADEVEEDALEETEQPGHETLAEVAATQPMPDSGSSPALYAALGALGTALIAGAAATGFAVGRRNE